MGKLENLYQLIEKENIKLEILDSLPDHIDGMYLKSESSYPIIVINKRIENDSMKFKIVLAEELGHHFTSVGDSRVMFNSYTRRLQLDKSEITALKWATEFLLPIDRLKEAFLKMHNRQIDGVTQELEVPHEFLLARLKFLSHKFDYIDLDDKKAILLTTLPNICTIEKIAE